MSKKLFGKFFVFLLVAGLLFAVAPTGQAQAQTPTTLNVAKWTGPTTLANVSGRQATIKVDSTYHMWYATSDTTLYHTSSTDPADFGTGAAVNFIDGTPLEVSSVTVLYEGTTFYMIAYETSTGGGDDKFAIYTSSDGVNWTYRGTVFDGATAFTGLSGFTKIDAPYLFKDGTKYRLYFQVKSQSGERYDIYTAESTAASLASIANNEADFALANNNSPVLSPDTDTAKWDGKYVMQPMVVKDGDTYYMWYSAYGTSNNQEIGFALSEDGYDWVKSPGNPVLSRAAYNAVGEPSVIKDGDTWRMWYLASDGIRYLTATGPFEFQTIQAAIGAAVGGETILVAPGTYAENVVINKPNLTLQSAGTAAETIVNAPEGKGISILKDLGTVTVDGFTVQGWTIAGIVQAFTEADGTNPIVKNNIVQGLLGDENYGNCIQVTGANSIVEDNIVDGAFYTGTGPYGASGIFVYLGDNSIVRNNLVTHADIGIAVAGGGAYGNYPSAENVLVIDNEVSLSGIGIDVSFDANNTTIQDNFVHDNELGLFEEYNWGYGPTGTVAVHNQLVNNTEQALTLSLDGTTLPAEEHIFMAEANWWGSIAGPSETEINEYVDYAPWCGDADCSFLVHEADTTSADAFQASITNTPDGDALYVPSSPPAKSGGYNVGGITLILGDGVKIQNNSSCFTVTDSYTKITTETIGGAVCVPTGGSHGIVVVNTGLTDITIEGLEIDGTDQDTGDGIHFAGAITDVIVRDNFIHDLDGDGVHFTTQPGGYVEIKGNLFMDNAGEGVDNAAGSSDIDATYNAWGDYDGPAAATGGDGISTNVDADPWTHVDVYVEYDDEYPSRYDDEVAVGEEITYNVYANLQNAFGAQFTMTFDPAKLEVTATDTTGTVFPSAWSGLVPGVSYSNTTGKITFAGGTNTTPVSGEDRFIYSVTFKGKAPTDVANPLSFAATDEALFGMNPGSGSSLNIYAAGMAGVDDVNVYDLPTLAISPLGNFAVGNPKEFTLTVTNPSTGRDYTNLNVDLVVPTGANLEYWDSGAWVDYVDGVDIGELVAGNFADVLFRITFVNSGNNTVTVDLYDGTVLLIDNQEFVFSVVPSYTVTGSVQMQGRTVRSGVLVVLDHNSLEYLYDTLSTDFMTGNYTLSNVAAGEYTLTITHARYLDFEYAEYSTADLDLDLARLELRGGDVVKNNEIDISDASLIGTNYGSIGGNDADANFDETVNIFDLAMVGGNYALTSGTAYTSWEP